MSIQEHLNKIRNAVYGHEVRESIAKGIETAYDDASENGNANMEVKVARGTHPNLKARLDKEHNEVAAQLAQKVDKGKVSVYDIDKNLGKLDQTYMTDEFIAQFVENTQPVNVVPADGSLTTKKFANNSVTLDKIGDKEVIGHQRTINLFDKNDASIETGGYYNGSEWVESSAHAVSGLIPVELNQGYTFLYKDNPNPFRVRIYFYNESGEYVTGGTSQSDKLVSSAYPYIRFTFLLGSIDSIMMIKDTDIPNGDLSVPYIPYSIPRYKLKGEWGIGNDNVIDGSLEGSKLDDVEKITINSINLFDKTDPNVQLGGYYNAGVWTVSNGNATSGFIKIEPNTSYTFYHKDPPEKVGSRINFYDSEFNYVTGGSSFSEKLSGGVHPYVRVTMQSAYVDSFMMIKDTNIPDDLEYIPFSETKFRFGEKWDVLNSNSLKPVIVDSRNNDLYSPNYTEPVKLDLKDFSGYNQAWHPSAQYIEAGFAGSKYWLAQSPYPNGGLPSRVRWEVPVVYKSDNGEDWEVVANPLDDLTQVEIDRGDYMSDPEIVWREDLGRLEVWYRHSVGTGTLPTTIFRKTTTDGSTWSAREVMITEKVATDPLFMRSPSITFEDGKYKAWFTNDSVNLFGRPLMYSESIDGKNWSNPIRCSVDIYRTPWHTSVTKIDDVYHYLCYYRPINWPDFAGIGETLFYYTSTDGINYKFERTILSTTDNNSSTFYKNGLYRSDVIKGHDGKIKLYFCFVDDAGKNSIGYMSADNLKVMNAVPKVDARNAVTRNGESLDDLQMKLDRLRLDFDNLLTQ